MTHPGLQQAYFPRHVVHIVCFVLCGLLPWAAGAEGGSSGKQMAEVSIHEFNAESETPEQPADFKNRLAKRRISEYASFDRALFGRSFDVGYGASYTQRDSFISERQLYQGFFLSTGLSSRTGIGISLGGTQSNYYYTIGPKPELLTKSRNSTGSLTLNHLLLPETLKLPQLVGRIDVGVGSQEGSDLKTRGAGLSTSRTLESSSLFGNFQFQQVSVNGGDWQNSYGLGMSYFLTVNHRLAVGLGYQISKSSESLSVPSINATVVYRLFPDWVLRSTASQVSGANESSSFGFDLTHTFQP